MESPYVVAALICEKVLMEQDGVASVIRIIDRLNVQVQPPGTPGATRFPPTLTIFIALKGGELIGDAKIAVDLIAPDGSAAEVASGLVKFERPSDGANIIIQGPFGIRLQGLHWFEIKCNGHALTRTPLEVVLAPSEPTESGSKNSSPSDAHPHLG
jgi:hypothetical protein